MQFFEQSYTVRHFTEPEQLDGGETADYTESTIKLDVQVVVPDGEEFNADGQRLSERLNSWGSKQLVAADPKHRTRGDWLLYDGDWYECVSCRHRNHTILRHWRGEWQRLPEGSEKYDGDASPVRLTGSR
jgi:hypothetical protein